MPTAAILKIILISISRKQYRRHYADKEKNFNIQRTILFVICKAFVSEFFQSNLSFVQIVNLRERVGFSEIFGVIP